jgi:hypothetical protein
MVQESVSFIVLDDEINIVSNTSYEKILNIIIFTLFTIWLNVFTIFILDYSGFKQDCMVLSSLCQTLPMLILSIPLIFTENTRKKLQVVFISIISADLTSVILYFVISSIAWEEQKIVTGCDIVTEIIKGTISLILGIVIQILF